MGELLLELLSEEIPARMQRRAIDELKTHLDEWLQVHRLRAANVTGYVTPRRLVVIADGIPARQPDHDEERRGPRLGSPDQAVTGFLRSVGLSSIDQCEVRATDRGEFYFAVITQRGRAAATVLGDAIEATLTSMTWPKSMRYPASELRWVRPLNSVICLFDGEVLDLPLGAVPVGRTTRGHRFLSQGEISVTAAADYVAKLAKAHVVLDWNERRAIIAAGLHEQAAQVGLRIEDDPGLLDEVTGLVEYPVVLMGSIDADFVRPLPDGLPPEVLATAMRTHQKYFTCLNPDGTPAPRFLFVANNLTPDSGKTIAAGNERVLRARLSDARFFWDQDRKVRLEDRVEALKQRVYHEKLGSMFDKAERMEKLAAHLAEYVPGADKSLCRRAARLAKADLSTGMVGEFPELQGVMGCYHALNDGDDLSVAGAIADHYKPLGPNDSCPTAPESIVVALADKIDALASFFWIGEEPTGSSDPYALRRAALGIIRIILENQLRLPLYAPLNIVATTLGEPDREMGNALEFITERLEVHLRSEGVRHDLVRAVFLPTEEGKSIEEDLGRLLTRVRALSKFVITDDGANLLAGYRRASNIVRIEENKDRRYYRDPPDTARFEQSEEEALWHRLNGMQSILKTAFQQELFDRAMMRLATLRKPIDEFFERVTVNVPEKELRENRLRLLARIQMTMNQIADFSQIEG